jgi:hypothetical protein
VPRFWLTYCDPARRLLGVVILDSQSLLEARLQALIGGTDRNVQLCEGHELDDKSAVLVPADAIGRMLSLKEASKIIQRIERGFPK